MNVLVPMDREMRQRPWPDSLDLFFRTFLRAHVYWPKIRIPKPVDFHFLTKAEWLERLGVEPDPPSDHRVDDQARRDPGPEIYRVRSFQGPCSRDPRASPYPR